MGNPASVFQLIHDTLLQKENLLTVSELCKCGGVSRSGYYKWEKNAKHRQQQEDADRQDFELILEAYRYRGYKKGIRSIHMRLLHKGIVMNPKKIRRLMQKYNLFCPIRKANPYRRMAKALKTNHIAENLVDRQFEAHGPRSVLLTDITYIPYNGTFCYLSTVIDAYTKQVLSYVLSESLEVDFVLRTIELLVERHGISLQAETMIHSDQGCHYTSYRFIQIVKDSGLRQSMSRRGNCWDNAPQESFFGHMKDELADEQPAWSCFKDISDSIDRWMDYYNTERYQWQLAKLSPNEFYEFITTGVYPLPCAAPEGYSGGSAP